jgi:hypothetical protein
VAQTVQGLKDRLSKIEVWFIQRMMDFYFYNDLVLAHIPT